MTWDRSKPWTAPARTLILYRTESGSWRFSIYNEGGIMDGHLADLGDNATLEEAQSALLARVEESSGLRTCLITKVTAVPTPFFPVDVRVD